MGLLVYLASISIGVKVIMIVLAIPILIGGPLIWVTRRSNRRQEFFKRTLGNLNKWQRYSELLKHHVSAADEARRIGEWRTFEEVLQKTQRQRADLGEHTLRMASPEPENFEDLVALNRDVNSPANSIGSNRFKGETIPTTDFGNRVRAKLEELAPKRITLVTSSNEFIRVLRSLPATVKSLLDVREAAAIKRDELEELRVSSYGHRNGVAD